MFPRMLHPGPFLFALVLLLTTATSACARQKPARLVPGPSIKELVPESSSETEDGVSQIIFAQLFKPGEAESELVGVAPLAKAPPLPTGYTLFKDRVYEIKTTAVATAAGNITVFRLPSVQDEQQFKKLSVLHLKRDEMSPSDNSWEDVTLFIENADPRMFQFIPKAKYEALQPDFKTKRIAGVSGEFGTFAIALAPGSQTESSEPFPEVTLQATSSPQPVQPEHEVTHTLTFTNKSAGAAAEVNVREVLDINLDYVSAKPSQGVCTQKTAGNNIVCHLGRLSGGASATIVLVSRARNPFFQDMFGKAESFKAIPNHIEVIFKQQASDFVDERGQIFSEVTTNIVNKR